MLALTEYHFGRAYSWLVTYCGPIPSNPCHVNGRFHVGHRFVSLVVIVAIGGCQTFEAKCLLPSVVGRNRNAFWRIRNKLMDWSPATFVGYNSIAFDEDLLRQALFQNLHPAYLRAGLTSSM